MKQKKQLLSFVALEICGVSLLSAPQAASASPVPYVAPPYTCVTNYYVDPNGKDTNNGSAGAPWKTVSGAVNKLSTGASHPGVCVNVNPGTYTESIYLGNLNGGWDGPQGYLVFRSSALHAATLQEPYANIWSKHNVTVSRSRYVIFDGFTVVGYTVPYAGVDGLLAMESHHVKFLNNIVHDIGGSGIGSVYSDYVYVQGNTVYNTACCNTSGTSAIDYWAPVAVDSNPGYHNVISSNIIYNNSEGSDGRSPHTEGHGIMLDAFRLGPAGSYPGYTLIENNLSYNNGGAGINLYYTNNVIIHDNTVHHNWRDRLMGYNGGDITVLNSSHVIGVNNIAVTDITTNSKLLSIWDQTWDHTNTGNVWANNLAFNGNSGQPSVSTFNVYGMGTAIIAANGNILGKNPLFVNPAGSNFTLQAGSPAIGRGTPASGVPVLDLAGHRRSTTIIDMGAFAYNVLP
jgi:hypothetical protein